MEDLRAFADKPANELQRGGRGLASHPLREWWGVLEDWVPDPNPYNADEVRFCLEFRDVVALQSTAPYPDNRATLPPIKCSPVARSTWGHLIDSIDRLSGGTELQPGGSKISDVKGKMARWQMIEVDYGDVGKHPAVVVAELGDAISPGQGDAEQTALNLCVGLAMAEPNELTKKALKESAITANTDLMGKITGGHFINEMLAAGRLRTDEAGKLLRVEA